MIETEVKILEIDPSVIRLTLKKKGAKFVRKVFQQNFFYSNDYTTKSKITVRVRKEGKKAILTVKANKRQSRYYKMLDEYETDVDHDAIIKILATLGYELDMSTEIKREYWQFNDCSVEICIAPKIPPFIEIEGSKEDIDRVAKILGYKKTDYVTEGVSGILRRYKITPGSWKF